MSFFAGDFVLTDLTQFMRLLILICGLIFFCVYFQVQKNTVVKKESTPFEQPILFATAILAMLILVNAQDFLMFYLAIEMQALTSYILTAFRTTSKFNAEAGLKFFISGAFISGVLLFGVSLVYLTTGSTSFDTIHLLMQSSDGIEGTTYKVYALGLTLILVTMLFKLGAVPFHYWLVDVFEGSTLVTTFFFAFVSKLGYFAALFKLMTLLYFPNFEVFQTILALITLITLGVGSLSALAQRKLKRFLALSTVTHTGYMLLGVSAGSLVGLDLVLGYLICYLVTVLGVFVVLLSTYNKTTGQYAVYLTDLVALRQFHPIVFIGFGLLIFSMAGIPFLAGFFVKYLIFLAA